MKLLKGVCCLFVEQSYEGHPWAFQDEAFIEPRDEEHPTEQWAFEGLHILKDGDELTIYSDEQGAEVVWSGILRFVDDEPTGIDRAKLVTWFREEFFATLLTSVDEEEEHG